VRPIRAKYLACKLAPYFSRSEFDTTGRLTAWPTLKTLVKRTHMNIDTVRQAIKDLEATGKLYVVRGSFNPKTRRNNPSHYYAVGYRKKRPVVDVPF
jgi:hypothetical protein